MKKITFLLLSIIVLFTIACKKDKSAKISDDPIILKGQLIGCDGKGVTGFTNLGVEVDNNGYFEATFPNPQHTFELNIAIFFDAINGKYVEKTLSPPITNSYDFGKIDMCQGKKATAGKVILTLENTQKTQIILDNVLFSTELVA